MGHWLWWLIGTVGISGALVIGVGVVFGWPVIIGTKIGRTLLAIATAGVGLAVLYAKARNEGAAAQRARQEKDDADFLDQVRHSGDAIDNLSDADLDRVLHDKSDPARPKDGDQPGLPDQRTTRRPQ